MDPKLADGYTRQFFRQCTAQTDALPACMLGIRRDLIDLRSKSRRAESFAGIVGRRTRPVTGKTAMLLSRDQQNRTFSLAYFGVGETIGRDGVARRNALAFSQYIIRLDSKADLVQLRQLHFPLRFSFHLISRLQQRGVIETLTFDSMLQISLRCILNYRYLNRTLPQVAPGELEPVVALPVDNPLTGAVGLIVGRSLGRTTFTVPFQPQQSNAPVGPDVGCAIIGATADTYISRYDMPPNRVFVCDRLHEIEQHRPPRDELLDMHQQVELQHSLDDAATAQISAMIQGSFGLYESRPLTPDRPWLNDAPQATAALTSLTVSMSPGRSAPRPRIR